MICRPFPAGRSRVAFWFLLASKPIMFIRLLNFSDLRPKTRNLVPKHFKMIHSGQDNASGPLGALEGKLFGPHTPDPVRNN